MDADYLKSLPKSPEGWTRKMVAHFNFGGAGGAATFDVFCPDGVKAPFTFQYDTRKNGLTGFSVAGVDGVMSWDELRAHYSKGE